MSPFYKNKCPKGDGINLRAINPSVQNIYPPLYWIKYKRTFHTGLFLEVNLNLTRELSFITFVLLLHCIAGDIKYYQNVPRNMTVCK